MRRGTSSLLTAIHLVLFLGGIVAAEELRPPLPRPEPKKDQAMPLRRLAKPLSDRGPFVDPTLDLSTEAVLRAPLPGRKRPIPFVAINLPDPYERRQSVKLLMTLEENPTPVTRFTRPPKR